MKSLEHYWYGSSVLVWLLLPLSWLYCLVTFVRRKLYHFKILKSYKATAPLIVVGNIVAGGSGKTPLLIALCESVQKSGHRPGVVSRGYGGSVSGVRQVTVSDMAEHVGDEPLLIHQRTKVPVVVGADRVAAVSFLLKNNDCDVVLSDDGLQHYRMCRDLEVAVVDARRKFGNGFCIPAGPLRETTSRLNDVDLVVYNGESQNPAENYSYRLNVSAVYKLDGDESRALSDFSGMKVHAVAGIGHPTRFFDQLHEAGLDVVEHAFSDHHHYQQVDFSGWADGLILMTEKDAVKCSGFDLSDVWVVAVSAILSDELENRFSSELSTLTV